MSALCSDAVFIVMTNLAERIVRLRRWPAIAMLGPVALTVWTLAACAPGNPTQVAAQEPTVAVKAPAVASTVSVSPTVVAPTMAPATATSTRVAIVATTVPTMLPQTFAAGVGGRIARYQGISFSYPAALAQDAQGTTVPIEEGGGDGPWWLPVPQHPEISLIGYVLSGTFQAPRIIVYPAREFASANAEAARRIGDLRQVLQTKPQSPDPELPFLPLFNAGQQMHVGAEYLSFQNGQGVRYLTQYSQAPTAINNRELFYTFQGMTADGQFY